MVSVKIQGHTPKSSWVNLPPDLLTAISDRLDITSSIRLSAVCTSWAATIHTCLAATPPYRPGMPIPWLLLSAQNSETDPNRSHLTFYDLPTNTSYSVPVPIPSLRTHRWLSSKKGWLLTCDPQSQLHLIKPLTGAHLLLPSKGIGIGRKLRHKVILCRTPDCAGGFLAVGCSQNGPLVFVKGGDRRWSTVNASQNRSYEDVVVYQEKLYALTSKSLCCWDLVGFSFKGETKISEESNRKVCSCWLRHLVEWRGELVMLSMHEDLTCQVKLGKLNLGSDHVPSHSLSPVRSIGDDALFIGTNYSYVVRTNWGVDNNVQGNCIYFTSDVCQPYYDAQEFRSKCAFRVFDLREEAYVPRSPPGSPIRLPLPICWFQPR